MVRVIFSHFGSGLTGALNCKCVGSPGFNDVCFSSFQASTAYQGMHAHHDDGPNHAGRKIYDELKSTWRLGNVCH